MASIEVPPVRDRPACLTHRQPGDEFPIVECVDYYINLLLSRAPAELTADYLADGKTVIWSVHSLPEKKLVHTETMPSIFYRQCLARIAVGYMQGCVYGGFSRMHLTSSGRTYSAAFYLGNDGLCGFWFKGRCGAVIDSESPATKNL
jgi:hypothetical protein